MGAMSRKATAEDPKAIMCRLLKLGIIAFPLDQWFFLAHKHESESIHQCLVPLDATHWQRTPLEFFAARNGPQR
jgi:hypothetical protein